MVPADSRRIPRVPRYSGYGYSSVVVRVRGCHPLWPLFPKRSAPTDWRYRRPTTPDVRKHTTGLGCSPFARHYWGNHCCFLFQAFSLLGCPIRKSPDQWSFAPTRGLSQLITSFIASMSLGIHRALFSTFAQRCHKHGMSCGTRHVA